MQLFGYVWMSSVISSKMPSCEVAETNSEEDVNPGHLSVLKEAKGKWQLAFVTVTNMRPLSKLLVISE
jgi:hypothetical protein